ncbi:hypothetical protein GN958_ATG17557 [Phytophthora infestans]|uniref:Uncharacterized protein n=1 Tax=Phytophthora infestans TaxID=4787 RepID=A0A8S9U1R4_PHYIN|nr:hypothetical protein GN958_ATG17556 [Phytophthora infestans]KAF4133257.1 hypothetical protein GN958_ATG17557 [Phytophthora infestans]
MHSLYADTAVLKAALAALLIHLEEVTTLVAREQAATGFTSHYLYRFHEDLNATNAALGSRPSLEVCAGWGRQLHAAWETESYAHLRQRTGGETTVLAAAVTQILTSMASMQRTQQKLVAMQEVPPRSPATTLSCCAPTESSAPPRTDVIAEAHPLIG